MLRDKLTRINANIIINYPFVGIKEPGKEPFIVKQTRPMSMTFTAKNNEIENLAYMFYLKDENGFFVVNVDAKAINLPVKTWNGPVIGYD